MDYQESVKGSSLSPIDLEDNEVQYISGGVAFDKTNVELRYRAASEVQRDAIGGANGNLPD